MGLEWAPIEDRIRGLIEMNKKQSEIFRSPNAQNKRLKYRNRHPTFIFVLQCMDGRIHLPQATGIPLGILRPFKTLGGKFDLGSYYFNHAVQDCVNYALNNGVDCVALITYHFSRGDNKHRGCAGCDNCYHTSVHNAMELKRQFEFVYGPEGEIVYPLVCGFETDSDSLVVHGENGEELDLGAFGTSQIDEMEYQVKQILGKMPRQILRDMMPLFEGNICHVSDVKARNRPIVEVEHREWIFAFGRGLDWLYEPNMALIVGPYDLDINTPIIKAAGIIKANMEKGRIPDDKFLFISSSHFSSRAGTSNTRAVQRSLSYGRFAIDLIRKTYPEFSEKMLAMDAITDLDTRQLNILNKYEF